MDNEQDAKKRLQLLLQQLELTSDEYIPHFESASLSRMTVHKKERVWRFTIQVEKLLPFNMFSLFNMRLREKFAGIADIKLSITCANPQVHDETIAAYWSFILQEIDDMSPPLKNLLNNQVPSFNGQTIYFTCGNDIELRTLKNKYSTRISEIYTSYGFPVLSIDFKIIEVESDIAEAQQAFMKQRTLEEEELGKKALADMQKRESNRQSNPSGTLNGPFRLGIPIKANEPIMEIKQIQDEERRITIEGYVFDVEVRELRSGRSLLTIKVTDYTDSILVKMFSRDQEDADLMGLLKKGTWLKIRGSVQNDTYVRDLIIMAQDIMEIKVDARKDTSQDSEKRIELHLHTPMSQMDAVSSVDALVSQAAKWGHPAVAITDHAVVQSFPDAYAAGKKYGIKIIYGLEINMVNDGVPIAYEEEHRALDDATYVVFDVETTGLSAVYNSIIELAAVKIKNGQVIDKYESFANPHHALSATTTDLTGITDDMVQNAPDIESVIKQFHDWIGDSILVAHNASFDMGFLYVGYKKCGLEKTIHPVIDTLELSRFLHPEMKNHRLNTMAKKFNIDLTQHHRAIYDAEATGFLLINLLKEAEQKGIHYHDEFNHQTGNGDAYKRARPTHCTLLAKDLIGLKNLFKLVSSSHMDTFFRVPRIPRSKLVKHRQGLLIGSGCDKGEVFQGLMQKSPEEVEEIAKFYDYLEVHPKDVYAHLIELELVQDEWNLEDIIRKMVKLGKKVDLPVVATGNVHYVNENDAIFRQILIGGQGGANPLNRHKLPKVHFRTTNEMLDAFAFLGEDVAKQIVVENSHKIAERIEEIKPIKDDLYTPKIEGSDEEVRVMSYNMARQIYGDKLPEIVEARIEKELKSIIGHGFAVIYLISHKLVKKSLNDGYLVGSRGSVGSSLVATLMEITEVNPLPPHYICPSCQHAEFFDDGSVSSGFDLPNKVCPNCDSPYKKDGQDIPFETFLGFKGDKVPDIDLNFSGEYQSQAHNYTKVLFGEDNVYRAGTIGTVAEKTAYGYVRGYANDHNLTIRGAEIDRLVQGCSGVKRSTGQHPGGIIVVPDYMDIFDFSPIQFPADAQDSEWKTTHFDFHSIHDNLLKLDILGHDDPTVIRMLQDLSGIDPKTIPTDDLEVMKIFSGTESLGVTQEQIGCKTGTLGIPEFGTRFVRQMLEETKPSTFSELVQISGLSHGTDVWIGNAQELIQNGTCVLSDVIGCRDDIMVYLIYQGLEPSIAFKIMESVRKGKGLTPEFEADMRSNGVPVWYIDACKKIKYMFPKAHAAAYVLMAVRIAYFKVHFPILYYAAYFTVRAADFDLHSMTKGSASMRAKIDEINAKGLDALPKEKSLLTVLEIALEMCERGYHFKKVDLYTSQSAEFIIDGKGLIPPFNAIPGLGTNVAKAIVEARVNREFLSKEDLGQRGRVSKTLIEYMNQLGCLEGMPEANQLSLF
ncbi:PolC-type DNA polymerase III [Paenisporosarcina sp. TG20]|uniref:PolC-type DNA polymerase III n=1 Tax=Paenisporosarcina sp. TG20 TaxID=1211706 RepID=UPI0002D57362|nr:PolC-type DNA polymerase III [Paenisporosarcina sp. TG20]